MDRNNRLCCSFEIEDGFENFVIMIYLFIFLLGKIFIFILVKIVKII